MKIGINYDICNLGGYSRFNENRFLKMRECGFEAVDYCLADTESELYTLPEAQANRVLDGELEAITSAGLFVSQVHGPWRWPADDATVSARSERMEKMLRSMEMSLKLGCKNWVIHPLAPCGWSEANTDAAKTTWDVNLEFMLRITQYAKERDITVCFENMPMPQFSIAAPEDTLKFVRQINDEHFRICFDTGHAQVFTDEAVGDAVRKLGEYIRVFHIHDSKWKLDLHLFPFMGVIDWADFSAAVKEIGYSGVFSLETGPSANLSDELFANTGKLLCNYAEHIINM